MLSLSVDQNIDGHPENIQRAYILHQRN